ncbi:MAG TPA: 2-hydroxy-3-oxopropionate reductase [Dehalococcoidia bacterium]|nr:2-hydroxy-3-oxopropionate reductase [Dehalococcoidia bacterium]
MKIGFIGLGIMGKPMAKNLIAAGYDLVVYNKSKPGMDELGAAGAEVVGSCKEVAEAAKIIITMLPDSADSELVITGPDGILEGASTGHIVIDMSSIAPLVSQKIAAQCAEKGVEMLDAPVSGGEPGAIAGTLSVMVGGKQEVFECCLDIMQVMGSAVVLTGDIGAGNTTKLANQIIVAANIAALSEAFVLAQKAGVDPEKVFDAIKGGLAGSNVMNAKGPMMLERNFNPGFRIRLHQKDLRNVLQTAQDLNVPLPVTALVQQMLGSLVNDGHEELDHAGILKFVEGLSNIEVKKQS